MRATNNPTDRQRCVGFVIQLVGMDGKVADQFWLLTNQSAVVGVMKTVLPLSVRRAGNCRPAGMEPYRRWSLGIEPRWTSPTQKAGPYPEPVAVWIITGSLETWCQIRDRTTVSFLSESANAPTSGIITGSPSMLQFSCDAHGSPLCLYCIVGAGSSAYPASMFTSSSTNR